MRWILTLSLFFSGSALWADTSVWQKLTVLRFASETVSVVQNGVLDITKLGEQEFIHAQGEVFFIPGEFIDPIYMNEQAFAQFLSERNAVKTPLRLKSFPYGIDGIDRTFGTFVLRVRNDKQRRLAIAIPRLFHSIDLSYVDEKTSRRLLIAGKLDKDPKRNRNFSDLTSTVPVVDVESDFLLFAKVSAPVSNNKNTLCFSSFYIGNESYINRLVFDTRFYATLVSGGFMIMFLFYSFIYSFRPKDFSSLYLAFYTLCCFALSLFYIVPYNITPQQLLEYFTFINLYSICALQFYLLDKISFKFSKRIFRSLLVVALLFATFASLAIMARLSLVVALLFMASFASSTILIFVTLYMGFKHRLSGIPFFTAGTIINSCFQFPILLSYIGGVNAENGYNILLANFGMAVSMALVNAKEFAVTYRKSLDQSLALEAKNKEITFFNKNLEKMVDNKTKEVRALLDYIPQGVLSIMEDGIISKDYSAHLKTILGDDNIGLSSFKALVLDRCEMSSDTRDQAWQTITASVGDYIFNFEVNSEKLPLELHYQHDNQDKFLKVTWNTEVEDDTVVRVLVTLLDVTAEKVLEKESEKQRRELSVIQELLNVPPNKIAQFFSTSIPLLKENERIIENAEIILDPPAIRMLFVNAHTVKGAARTLQLKDLARQIHDMEEYYAEILKKGSAIERDRLRADIHESFRILNHYIAINRDKLNRSDNYDKVVIERDFIEKHYFIIKDLIDDPPLEVHRIINWLRDQNEALTSMIFEQLPATFDGYKERAIKIAKDIGRAEPKFEFEIHDVSIAPNQKTVLDNCMVHLLRNALDHGIETPEERKKSGKPEAGTLFAATRLDGENLTILLNDDGRGLALRRLRAKGEQLGLIQANASLQEVADLIFASGISTAYEVSDISGRGVGMSAVQTFLERAGGSIAVSLGKPKDEQGEYYEFSIEIRFTLTPVTLSKAS